MKFLIYFLLITRLENAFGANILYFSPVLTKSHYFWNRILAIELVRKGHNVTFVTPEENIQERSVNLTVIELKGYYDAVFKTHNLDNWMLAGGDHNLKESQRLILDHCIEMIQNENFLDLMKKRDKYDLLIVENTCGSCVYPLIHHFGYPPTVAVTPFLLPTFLSFSFGNPLLPTINPVFLFPYSTKMNLRERFWNSVYTYLGNYYRFNIQYEKEYNIAKTYFGDGLPPMPQLEKHISILLANTDPILDHPQPLSPNIIPVGGLHVTAAKPLPESFLTILNSAKNGVIVFSLGTNVRSDKLSKKVKKHLLSAFSKLKETVIWKYESEMSDLPNNVQIRSWLPQNDLLEHPNVKLFIGHGGALSLQEAIVHGVPTIIMPFIVDQFSNAKIVIQKEIGTEIEVNQITTEYVFGKIRQVLDNPKYLRNVKRLSTAFKNQKETPLERAVFWIEYVLQNGKTDFLDVETRNMPFHKSTGLDILLLVLILYFIILWSFYNILKQLFKLCLKKQKVE